MARDDYFDRDRERYGRDREGWEGRGLRRSGGSEEGYGQGSYGQAGFGRGNYLDSYGQGYFNQSGFGSSGYAGWNQDPFGYGQGVSYGLGGYDETSYGARGLEAGQSRFEGGWRRSGRDISYGAGTGRFAGRGPKGYRRSDERIREEVSEELTRHPEIDASEIEVQVQNGEVTLTGKVEDRHQKRLAEDLAERCAGVDDVHNRLKVDQGFFAKLFGTGESEEHSRQESTRDTSTRRGSTSGTNR